MDLFRPLEASGSGMAAERFRLDLIAENLANMETTRAERAPDGSWLPYRRKVPLFVTRPEEGGVEVAGVIRVGRPDGSDLPRRYDPAHPDADREGYVRLPNVDLVKEMTDLITATRAYEANVAAVNAFKAMFRKALEIGRA